MTNTIDQVTQEWINELKEEIQPTRSRIIQPIRPRLILEWFRPHPRVTFEILDTIAKIGGEKGSASREGIHKAVKKLVPGSDTLDLYLNDLKKTGHIEDTLVPYRLSGRVLNKHQIKLTEGGRKAIPVLFPLIQEYRRIHPDQEWGRKMTN